MLVTEKFSKIPTDLLAPLGLIKTNKGGYLCTPVNAVTFATIGVDGIHFCIIPEINDLTRECSPVYVISPMMFDNEVNIVAKNFYDFISLVIKIKDASRLECISYFNYLPEGSFLEGTQNEEPDESYEAEVNAAIAALSEAFHGNLREINDVYAYVKKLQAETDLSTIQYSDEYYEVNS